MPKQGKALLPNGNTAYFSLETMKKIINGMAVAAWIEYTPLK
jgi:hypothetical protein